MSTPAIDAGVTLDASRLAEAAAVGGMAFMTVASIGIAIALLRRRAAGLPLVTRRPVAAAGWDGVTVALVAALGIGCQFAAVLVASTIEGGEQATITTTKLFAASIGTIVAAVAGTALVLAAGGTPRSLGIFFDDPREDLRLAVGTLLLVTPPLLVISAALGALVPYEHPILELLTQSRGPGTLAAVAVSAVVAAPLAEELFFRGVLQGWFSAVASRRGGGDGCLLPVVASSLCFAAAHVEHGLGWIPLIGFGLAVGLLRAERGSLLPCVIVHALFNAVSLALLLVQL